MYSNGQDVPQSYEEAVKWFRKAAEQGHVNGQNNLGEMYYFGLGVSQSYEEAAKWYRKAAEQGHANGQSNQLFQIKWKSSKIYALCALTCRWVGCPSYLHEND